MSSRRFSVRFNLNYSEDKTAWEFLHRTEGKSINQQVIDAINFYEQNQNLPQMLRLMAEKMQAPVSNEVQIVGEEDDHRENEDTVLDFLEGM